MKSNSFFLGNQKINSQAQAIMVPFLPRGLQKADLHIFFFQGRVGGELEPLSSSRWITYTQANNILYRKGVSYLRFYTKKEMFGNVENKKCGCSIYPLVVCNVCSLHYAIIHHIQSGDPLYINFYA